MIEQIVLASSSTCNIPARNYFTKTQTNLKKHKRPWMSKDIYKQVNAQKRLWVESVRKSNRSTGNYLAVLKKLTFMTNIEGIGHPSAETLHRELKSEMSYPTVNRALAFWVKRGVLDKTRASLKGIKRGFRKLPSTYRLIGFKPVLVDSNVTLINHLTIQDLKPNTYMHPPSDDRPKNVCPSPPVKKKTFSPVTHIDENKLKDPVTRKDEILRACHSRKLNEPDTQYAVERMGKDLSGVVCEAAFLAAMLKALQTNSWSKVDKQKPDSGYEKAKQAERKSQALLQQIDREQELAASPEMAIEFLRKMRASINLPGG